MSKLRRHRKTLLVSTVLVLFAMSAWGVVPRNFCITCVAAMQQMSGGDCHEEHSCCPSVGMECYGGGLAKASVGEEPEFSTCPVPPACFVISSGSNFLLPESVKESVAEACVLCVLPGEPADLSQSGSRLMAAAGTVREGARPLHQSNCVLRI